MMERKNEELKILFILWLSKYSIVYMYHIFFHSSIDGHLDCFHILAIVTGTAMNIRRYIYIYIYMYSESEVAQLCPTLRDPMDCSLPGSSVHGIFQARVLEWGAIAFSNIYVYTHTYTYVDFQFMFLFSLLKYLEVEFLDHMIVLV